MWISRHGFHIKIKLLMVLIMLLHLLCVINEFKDIHIVPILPSLNKDSRLISYYAG